MIRLVVGGGVRSVFMGAGEGLCSGQTSTSAAVVLGGVIWLRVRGVEVFLVYCRSVPN